MSSVLAHPRHSSTSSDPSSPESSSSHQPKTTDAEEEDLSHLAITEDLKRFTISGLQGRFFGSSSGFALMRNAHGAKQEITGRDDYNDARHFRRTPNNPSSHQWEEEIRTREESPYDFPESSLLVSLISLYFERHNPYFPTIYEPTFRKSVIQGLHLNDREFGAVVLAVCALGARFSDDERVLSVPGHTLSAGWKWFKQIHPTCRTTAFDMPSLYELQYYCLAGLYTFGTPCPSLAWTIVGIGIRRAVEMGAHRRMPDGHKPTVNDEQKKRIFWVLITADRLICNFLGRPSAIRDEDFDLELPIECDDEYWQNADPEKAFVQPHGQPPRVSFFIATIKLCEILSFLMKTMYSLKKSQLVMGILTESWEQKTASDLDSALNDWKSKLPEHSKLFFFGSPHSRQPLKHATVQWNPDAKPGLFFDQSAFAHTLFYVVQIQVHRRFVRKSSPMSFASLAICTTATKSCINVLDTLVQKSAIMSPVMVFLGFTTGVLLLTNVWGSKKAGIKVDYGKAANDVERLLRALQSCENRYAIAGKFGDLVYELARGLGENDTPCQSKASVPPNLPGRREGSHNTSGATTGQPPLFVDEPAGFQGAGVLHGSKDSFQAASMETDVSIPFQEQDFINAWSMPDMRDLGFQFDDWNTYAANVSALDLDAFLQNNPYALQ
ncbi:Gypsy retrotransposon integrase-like protein 1 [Marasmius crinis-equi]|uniref:Gypsy retrotransposon integrase-like protein 1 n=1 Tax=Marasmius crinis-equi TaxID=585013 RepID=A0ABR3FQN8_9AGAR